MNFEMITMNGSVFYVWGSFLLTFVICFFMFIKTSKTLKKLEKDFIKESKTLSQQELETLKEQKVIREILVSHPRI